jgi:hypothetical protein
MSSHVLVWYIHLVFVVVSPPLRPLYTALSDSLSELGQAARVYLGADAMNLERVQQLRQQVNALESDWFQNEVWCSPLAGQKVDHSSASPATRTATAEVHSPPSIDSEVLAGQAILSRMVHTFYQLTDRMLRQERDPSCAPPADTWEQSKKEIAMWQGAEFM